MDIIYIFSLLNNNTLCKLSNFQINQMQKKNVEYKLPITILLMLMLFDIVVT